VNLNSGQRCDRIEPNRFVFFAIYPPSIMSADPKAKFGFGLSLHPLIDRGT
jgi:hypothetical protein